MQKDIILRALEKTDLDFVHKLNNNRTIMSYWFEEPYESFNELSDLYHKHIHDNTERRFIAEDGTSTSVGFVELLEINYIHRSCEFSIIISPSHQGKGFAKTLIKQALNYAFTILNLNKVYLQVAEHNLKAIHLYKDAGFIQEGLLIDEYFTEGQYVNVLRMYMLQRDFFKLSKR